MPTAAFINALAEEGTKDEVIHFLQKQWDENCRLRAALREVKGFVNSQMGLAIIDRALEQ